LVSNQAIVRRQLNLLVSHLTPRFVPVKIRECDATRDSSTFGIDIVPQLGLHLLRVQVAHLALFVYVPFAGGLHGLMDIGVILLASGQVCRGVRYLSRL